MWKLKLKYPFGGYGFRIFLILFWVCMFESALADTPWNWLIPILTIVTTVMISYLLINRPEKEALQNAKPLEWRKLTTQEKEAVRKDSDTSFLHIFMLIGIFAVLSVIVGLLAGHSMKERLLLALFILIPATALILTEELKKLFWFHIDDSAECAKIQIHHTNTVKFNGRIGTGYYHYAVFYTPEGKFRVPHEWSDGDRIYLIRFRGRFRYHFPQSA